MREAPDGTAVPRSSAQICKRIDIAKNPLHRHLGSRIKIKTALTPLINPFIGYRRGEARGKTVWIKTHRWFTGEVFFTSLWD
jgi:hypothetical protein